MSSIISDRIDSSIYNENEIKGKWGDCQYKFNIFKNVGYVKQRNLISVSLFLLIDVDEVYASQKNIPIEQLRSEHENKTSCYINGVETILMRSKEFNVRVYCDSSSIRFVENHLRYKNLEIVYFKFDNFFNIETNRHYGFFGTLIRYIPLFNFPNFNNDWVSVTILDLENNFYNAKKLINYFLREEKNKSVNLLYWSRPCYYLSTRMFAINMSPKNFSIISSLIIQKKQQDHNLFVNFLNNCLLNKNIEYEDVLVKYLDINFNKRFFNGKLEYGVDEYFINYYFLNECYIKTNQSFDVVMYKDVSGGFLEWIKNIRLTIPRIKVKNEEATKNFINLIIEYFFPANTVLPDIEVNELIDWIAERYYKLNFQYSHRKIDQTREVREFYERMKDDKYKELDIYEEYMKGLEIDNLLKNNYYNIFMISPDVSYPDYKYIKIAEVARG